MTLAQLIPIAIQASIFLLVFSMGLQASFRDAAYLFMHPWQFLRSIAAMNVVMLVFAIAAATLFDIDNAIKIALVALALSPVPPILPRRQESAGGGSSYTIGLLIGASLAAIVIVPIAISVLGRFYGTFSHIPVLSIAKVVLISVVGPALIGMAVREAAPDVAAYIHTPVSRLAAGLLVVAALPLLISLWPQMWAMVGNGTLVALMFFSIVGLITGHLLGGPDPDDRTVLALATAARHPGMALAIANLTFPDEKGVLAVIVWHLIVAALVAAPYVKWRVQTHASPALKF